MKVKDRGQTKGLPMRLSPRTVVELKKSLLKLSNESREFLCVEQSR